MLELAGIAIEAVSTGGLETCIQLPGYGLCFDLGRCPRSAVSRGRVLFTHAHIDHMGAVVQHAATRDLLGLGPPTYVVPEENAAAFDDLFAVWRRLDKSDLPYHLISAAPGDEIPLGRDVFARAFRSPHRVPCLGYALVRRRRKLRPELLGLAQAEIRARRLAGEEVTVAHDAVEVAFTGDSLIEVVEREPMVREATVLVMEVTFLDERVTVEQTRSKGHIHLDEVIEREALFGNRALLFTHLSARYDAEEALDVMRAKLPPGLRERASLLMPDGTAAPCGVET